MGSMGKHGGEAWGRGKHGDVLFASSGKHGDDLFASSMVLMLFKGMPNYLGKHGSMGTIFLFPLKTLEIKVLIF